MLHSLAAHTWFGANFIPPRLPSNYHKLPLIANTTATVLHAVGFESCEDAVSFGESLVLISCDPARKQWNTVMGPLQNSTARGAIWLIDPIGERTEHVQLKGMPQHGDFHPLGIEWDKDTSRLFVINHQRERNTIEVFDLALPDSMAYVSARHAFTLEHDSFTGAPNSIAIIPNENAFYLSHDHRHTRRSTRGYGSLLNAAETILSLPLSRADLIQFEPPTSGSLTHVLFATPAATGLAFANGLALSRSGTTLAVASTTRRQVVLYARNSGTNLLTEVERVSVPMLVDNLSTAPAGWSDDDGAEFVAAGHPFYWPLLLTARSKEVPSWMPKPMSMVVQLSKAPEQAEARDSKQAAGRTTDWNVQTLYASSGDGEDSFGMSTTGVPGISNGKKWLAVVGLYERGVKIVKEV